MSLRLRRILGLRLLGLLCFCITYSRGRLSRLVGDQAYLDTDDAKGMPWLDSIA